MSKQDSFALPRSFEEADERIRNLVAECEEIELSVSAPNKLDATGSRMDGHTWAEWRTRAKFALLKKRDEVRRLKAWKKGVEDTLKLKLQVQKLDVQPDNTASLVSAAYFALKAATREGYNSDKDLLDLLRVWLQMHADEWMPPVYHGGGR